VNSTPQHEATFILGGKRRVKIMALDRTLLIAMFSMVLGPVFASVGAAQEILPFPPVPSASQAGVTIESSTYNKRVEPKRLPENAPNILVILMDDLGPGTPSTYGGEINTPNLDRVSNAGISYNRFHSTAMCSPTRAALLTGRNHTRVGNGQIYGPIRLLAHRLRVRILLRLSCGGGFAIRAHNGAQYVLC
jgi:hypothetical protein